MRKLALHIVMTDKKMVYKLAKKPQKLFLIDSLGAWATAFLLFVVWRNFHEYIGLPKTTLTWLALIAVCFACYSLACFLFLKQNWTPFLRGMGVANLLYCILTAGVLITNWPYITMIGVAYFVGEAVMICALACIEFKVAKFCSIPFLHG